MQLKALLFDLDGTLVDTAPDMVGSLNRVLANHGEPLADIESASKVVSNGGLALIKHGFVNVKDEEFLTSLVTEFLSDYAQFVAEKSRLYPGIKETLELCQQHDIPWGVVTNKPLKLSRSLLDGLDVLADCRILLGGDSLPVKKPHPAPLLHCCMTLNVAASECLYIGDHNRDIEAGRAAGMDTAAALWGYIQDNDLPTSWGADYLLKTPKSLYRLVSEKLDSPNR